MPPDKNDQWTELAADLGLPAANGDQQESHVQTDHTAAAPPSSDFPVIEVPLHMGVLDFRARMQELGIPLSHISSPGVAEAIEKYSGPNRPLFGFLFPLGCSVAMLRFELASVVNLVLKEPMHLAWSHRSQQAL